MAAKKDRRPKYYFPRQLKEQLAKISQHPVTVLEAPSGFGKTTAVREYLKEKLPEGARQYWYTCLGEPRSIAWKNICRLLAQVNPELGNSLNELKMPTMDSLMYLAEIIRDLTCTQKTYLVIDNYQLVDCDLHRELISVFSMHESPRLHLIFITQNLGTRPRITFHNADVHVIDADYFFFDKKSTAKIFRLEGIRLTGDKLNKVYVGTEGWISAIRLQIISYKQTGSLDDTADIVRLVETAIWNRLTAAEKEFLISVSVMGSFTARQAAALIGEEILPPKIKRLLKENDFIRFFPREHIYTIHSILLDYLRNQFYHYKSENFQHRILRRAGHCYATDLQLFKAAKLFYKVKDFDAIFSLPFDCLYLAEQREGDGFGLIRALVAECPPEVLAKYPFVLLMFLYTMLLDGDLDTFAYGGRLINRVLEENPGGLTPAVLSRLRGEFTLLKSLASPPDLGKMAEGAVKAYERVGEGSGIISAEMPWSFGNVSLLGMLWNEREGLNETLGEMERFLPRYLRVTRGHGSGADSALRAEALLMKGADEEAEVLCHRALYEARSRRQLSIGLCAELTLARIAILRGDVNGYTTAVKNIESYAREHHRFYVLPMVDLSLAFLSLALGMTDRIARWLYDLEGIERTLYAPAIPSAQIIYSYLLLEKKQYSELYGISQSILERAEETGSLLPGLYQLLLLAIARYEAGNREEAMKCLDRALGLAIPDGLFLPFSLSRGKLHPLLASSKKRYPEQKDEFETLLKLCRRQAKGGAIIREALLAESLLTPREREVAVLAKKRLSRREIAEKLYISELTVKTYLQNIYSKLDVHSRAELSATKF